ncbi:MULTISPECIES: hypothetical protein [Streptococcus]|uniref:Uncharacterized protein n=1 Tax=Streptococcus ruminantium TaxID=1917441 RepID=A0A2Z5U5F7_9STRE|nr:MULTISPECIES: hypothetical protein [Streptococcus]MDQ8759682.1 hypothetical protein [Streptococcus ruminantium]MDQ8765119.1 hypothetical protein [Streptococcus ruminantium]MDQ8769163.1 hypothetical protein [Streptococcus ruminantium]MDQ8774556.1 hypothetical protein [Streptococcus ruminantium]MDQ8780239.1 hypothetical protein [Streptococcus ruminantium]
MELVLPNNYVALEEEEMMYLDGGFYISYGTLKAFAISAGINPLGSFLIGLGLYKVGALITAKAAIFGMKIGSIGGPVVAGISGLVSSVIGGGAAFTIARALIERKGIGVDLAYTRNGIPYWVDINIR